MIQRLLISNYALIESVEIQFSDQLTIITGETGAGKSILLGALGLVMGNRADLKVLYSQEKKCVVEAHFNIKHYNLQSFFVENDIDYEEELIIRRELTPSGKSRAFVNDTPTTLNVLKSLSGALIDLHQQFDTQDINNVSFQLRMIDALAGNDKRLNEYSTLYSRFQTNKKSLQKLIEKQDATNKELDFLHFQLEEFDKAGLVIGEQNTLESEQKTLSSAEEIKSTLTAAKQLISESDYSILNQLAESTNKLNDLSGLNETLKSLSDRLNGLVFELEDLTNEIVRVEESTEYDEERIAEITERLDLIYKLQTKHQVTTVDQLLDIQSGVQKQLSEAGDLHQEIETLQTLIDGQEDILYKLAEQLTKKRQSVIPQFEKKVQKLLKQLSMKDAQLKVEVTELEALNNSGIDQINFLFTANAGGRLETIKKVASGGELSRLALCTKSLVADAIPLPTLIYDEIDAGVSGNVALEMGNILNDLASRHQVISITHTPQIAGRADKHYLVYKAKTSGKTLTKLKELSKEEKITEIATMLSGSPPTNSALVTAKELLVKQV